MRVRLRLLRQFVDVERHLTYDVWHSEDEDRWLLCRAEGVWGAARDIVVDVRPELAGPGRLGEAVLRDRYVAIEVLDREEAFRRLRDLAGVGLEETRASLPRSTPVAVTPGGAPVSFIVEAEMTAGTATGLLRQRLFEQLRKLANPTREDEGLRAVHTVRLL